MEKTVTQQSNTKKQFEINLYDEIFDDKTGQTQYRRVIYDNPIIISASNKKELDEHAARFKICGQIMKIVREIPTQSSQISTQECESSQLSASPTSIQAPQSNIHTSLLNNTNTQNQKEPPKYYSISGIDIKDDNGKIYQKQWVRLSDKDAENFRIINDSNNKVIQLTGKHIEMKRWVLVENVQENETMLESDLINE